MARPVITLTTDFGTQDTYVGTMKGVILGINPEATVVDLCHEIAPQDVLQGALVLHGACRYFPEGTVHVAVVDPGVGGQRRPIAIATGQTIFVGPDNGVFSFVVPDQEQQTETTIVHLTNPRYWLPEVSNTFHGRDIFAPVAAHLSLGTALEELGEVVEDMVRFSLPQPEVGDDGTILAQVLRIDRFGNVITSVPAELVSEAGILVVEVGGHRISGLCRTYSQVASGTLVALIGSGGFLEVAVRDGSAARRLGLAVGAPVIVRR